MNLVDKQQVTPTQIGQNGSQVTGALDGRAGGDFEVDLHLVGYNGGQGGFAQAGGSVQQHVVQGFISLFGRFDQDLDVLFNHRLAKIAIPIRGTQARLQALLCWLYIRCNRSLIHGIDYTTQSGKSHMRSAGVCPGCGRVKCLSTIADSKYDCQDCF